MIIGLLWYDGDAARTLDQKVQGAAARYSEKHGERPDTCYAHPSAVGDHAGGWLVPMPDGREIRVLPAPNILPNHWWIGKEEHYHEAGETDPSPTVQRSFWP